MVDREHFDMGVLLRDLNEVGAAKPVSYLPLHTVRDLLSLDVNTLAASTRQRGLQAKIFSADKTCIYSGAIYVYDAHALQHILDEERESLLANNWPTDADAFVSQVASVWLEPEHPIFVIIQRAFGDFDLPVKGVAHGG
jgi:hypothetical protein